MFLLLASFLAGVLTSLAPCVLPMLPVIVGSSLVPDASNKKRNNKPYIIAASLGVSVILFTLFLKASTVLIGINPSVWTIISGVIVLLLGITMLFPNLWVQIGSKIGLEHSSNSLLAKAHKKDGTAGAILTGAALGPVFSSCSPVYALVLATVLPINIVLGMVYIVAYAAGLSLALLAMSLLGRRATKKLGWALDPGGWFRRILAIILILVGIGIIFGYDKKIQTWAIVHIPFSITSLDEKLLPKPKDTTDLISKPINNKPAKFNIANPYPAPEITGVQDWVNSEGESFAKLKGKVVLIDFWTYSCINCQRTQPYLNAWYKTYKDMGFEIIGVHAPEFAFEKVLNNVQNAVKDAGINYPVGLDNNFATWKAYNNQYWPAKYLIDKDGLVRFTHFGEGKYEETEKAIQALLAENGAKLPNQLSTKDQPTNQVAGQTPETYLNYSRGERFTNVSEFAKDSIIKYLKPAKLELGYWGLSGVWNIGQSESFASGADSTLYLRFSAKEVYLVMSNPNTKTARVYLDGQLVTTTINGGSDVSANGDIAVGPAKLYKIIKSDSYIKNGLLEIKLPADTIINAFTFGS